MPAPDILQLTQYAKSFTNFTPEKEGLLREMRPHLAPRLAEITGHFYETLQGIPETQPVLAGRIDALKQTHVRWLEMLLTGPYDESFTAAMYRVGEVHVKVKLPVEFMAGGMTLIGEQLTQVAAETYAGDTERIKAAIGALNAILGLCLFVMQQSYQTTSLNEELEKFLKITSMSRKLFENLAAAYR